MIIPKYTMGIGDRFGQQGKAQLSAIIAANDLGINVHPVWNKSYREHSIIRTSPEDVRLEADSATSKLNWNKPYFVDADHINMSNVDGFISSSDFFTLDVADAIGKQAPQNTIDDFIEKHKSLCGEIVLDGVEEHLQVTPELIRSVAETYLFAIQEAGRLFRHISKEKATDSFITEVSMDETPTSQTPIELLVILAAISDENIPAQTIAPRFSGRFNKGVDYVGSVDTFAKEFRNDLAVISYATANFSLPEPLKLSIHSGSDKFSIYPVIRKAIQETGAGLHLKTAGTTWLEELIGLAEAGGEGLKIAQEVYRDSLFRYDELCTPYADVIDIDINSLPSVETVATWSGSKYASTLRHDQTCQDFNPNFRQLLHVGYKVAAEMEERYLEALNRYSKTINPHVKENLLERHIKALWQ